MDSSHMESILKSFIFCLILTQAGCSSLRGGFLDTLPQNWGKEEGFIWCNDRYLTYWGYKDYTPGSANEIDRKMLDLSAKGYIYALAAALVLQEEEDDVGHRFIQPAFLERDPEFDEDQSKTGFQSAVFINHAARDEDSVEIIVAFAGTNEFKDWFTHNLRFSPKQFEPARTQVQRARNKYPHARLIVTGFSLGGGLAVHVSFHENTYDLVKEAWAFNASPRTGVDEQEDKRIYSLAVEGEILNWFRGGWLGASEVNHSEDFGLVNSSSLYGHSRWVLTRQMLFFADLKEYSEASCPKPEFTHPIDIIRRSGPGKGCGARMSIIEEMKKQECVCECSKETDRQKLGPI